MESKMEMISFNGIFIFMLGGRSFDEEIRPIQSTQPNLSWFHCRRVEVSRQEFEVYVRVRGIFPTKNLRLPLIFETGTLSSK